jgi:hypothetical protein
MPVNYNLGKIYKIVDLSTNKCYIGSTCEPTLARRLTGHVRNFRHYQSGKSNYITSFKILEGENYDIQLIEAYPCNSKMELHAREGYWIRRTDCVNKIIAGRTLKEYFRERYMKNKDKISEYKKEYQKSNKAKISEHKKEYYVQNKQTINSKQLKKCNCPCGMSYTVGHKARHLRSLNHQQYESDYEAFILSNNPTLDQLMDFIRNRNSKKHYIQQFKNVLWHE